MSVEVVATDWWQSIDGSVCHDRDVVVVNHDRSFALAKHEGERVLHAVECSSHFLDAVAESSNVILTWPSVAAFATTTGESLQGGHDLFDVVELCIQNTQVGLDVSRTRMVVGQVVDVISEPSHFRNIRLQCGRERQIGEVIIDFTFDAFGIRFERPCLRMHRVEVVGSGCRNSDRKDSK